MVRKLAATLFMSAAFVGLPTFTGGCDRTVSETKTVKDGPGGTSVKEEKTVKKADGTTETTVEKKSVPNP